MEKAARLYGAAAALRERLGAPLPPCDRAEYQRRLARLRATLGKQALALAWAEGRALSYDQSVQYGLGTSDS